jgi:serine/threonine protein kinase
MGAWSDMSLTVVVLIICVIAIAVVGSIVRRSYRSGQLGALSERLRRHTTRDGPHMQATFDDGRIQVVRLHATKEVTIGRGRQNHLVIDSPLVSRHHASIIADGARWIVQDNDSSNGTFINGRPLIRARCPIMPSDDIEIGPVHIRLILPQHHEVSSAAVLVAEPGPSSLGHGNTSQQMFGPFAVIRDLGQGGTSEVVLAQDTRNNQQVVALKLLNVQEAHVIDKFRREGAVKLDHPHIARVIETGDVSGRPYIAVEYIEGISLRRLLNHQTISIDAALIIIGQVLQALDHAHANGIIHRDIKPENIMLSSQDGIKVIDFGIAKVLSAVTRTRDGLVLGTPIYMSFEQATGRPVNMTSDLYAAAIVLYEMLTTKVPFSSTDPTEIVRQHQRALPLPPRQLNPAIPPHVEVALLRALEKEASHRFQGAVAFARALGCPLEQPLPQTYTKVIAQLALPIYNERGNALELPTRIPASRAKAPHGTILRVQSGPRKGASIPLNRSHIIGRNDIDPSDGTISREHFRIELQSTKGTLYDISSYGTVVNGVRLAHGASCPLTAGAVIQVGQTVLVYEISG